MASLAALLYTAALTGMRASELRGLTWQNVDFRTPMISVRQRADEKGLIGSVKSAAGRRDIPISDQLASILKAWKLECPPGDLVFPNWRSNPESLANIFNRCWSKALEHADIGEHYNFHTLRHFHASSLIASGANPKEVQTEMGHASIKLTYDLYGHLFPEDLDSRRDRAQRLASALLN